MRTRIRGFRGVVVGGVIAVGLSALLSAASSAPVADAVMKGDKAAVKALLKEGADVNAAQGDGMTALHWAARSGDAELTRMLLYAGANVKANTRLGRLLAAHDGRRTRPRRRHRGAAVRRRRREGRQRHRHDAA